MKYNIGQKVICEFIDALEIPYRFDGTITNTVSMNPRSGEPADYEVLPDGFKFAKLYVPEKAIHLPEEYETASTASSFGVGGFTNKVAEA